MTEILFVSLGAILGANTRFKIFSKLEKLNFRKDFSIFIINTFASFCLGLFLSFVEQFRGFTYYYPLVLFFSIGFFGSRSTFSTFVYELFQLCVQLKIFRALKLFIISLTLGSLVSITRIPIFPIPNRQIALASRSNPKQIFYGPKGLASPDIYDMLPKEKRQVIKLLVERTLESFIRTISPYKQMIEVEIADNVTVEVIRGTGVQSLMNGQEIKK